MNRHQALPTTKGFTLMEMMAVVILILIMVGIASVSFANSRPSIKVKTDAANMVSFLRNMWDRTKASGSPLILTPDFEDGTFSYTDPRAGKTYPHKMTSDAVILGVKLNDRLFSRRSMELSNENAPDGGMETTSDSLFLSEGRGLSLIAVIFGIPGEEDREDFSQYQFLTIARLNLITGKGKVQPITAEELEQIFEEAEAYELERGTQETVPLDIPTEVPDDSDE